MKPSKALIAAVKAVIAKEEELANTKQIIDPIHQSIIDEVKPQVAPEWLEEGEKPYTITSWNELHDATEEDCDIIFEMVDSRIKEAGFNVKPGYCPILMCENEIRDLERVVVDVALNETGFASIADKVKRDPRYTKELMSIVRKLV